MKITLLGSGSYRSSLSIRLVAIGQQLSRFGWDVSLIVPSADKYNEFTPEEITRDGEVTVIQPWQTSTTSAILNLVPYLFTSFVAGLKTRPDAIYLYKPTPITAFGLILKVFFGIPVILDLDDLGSEVMRAEKQSPLMTRLVDWSERITLKYATVVVVTATFLEARVKNKYPDKPVLVLPNGVDPSRYPVRKAIAVRPAIYYFGMINRFSLIEPLLAAVPDILLTVPEARVTIIGGGSALNEAKAYAKKLGITKVVEFTGMTNMFGATDHTQFGDIGICYQPDVETVRAASNMKVFQYMALSTVLVVSAVGDLPLYLDHNRAGVGVVADDHSALGQAIIRLLLDPDGRVESALYARSLSETTYSWDNLGKELATFIKRQTIGLSALKRRGVEL
jgi:glycosyltransferase involved in cell wall biosynthesis